ncbi:MAG: hypothetical protein V2A71_07070, partial [Candidatus Eisenbacteria bacterium]
PTAYSEERRLASHAVLAGLRARFSERARLTLRYQTKISDRSEYQGLTGPFDASNLVARVEARPASGFTYSLAFEDKEKSNDELMSSYRARGPSGFVSLTISLPGHPTTLRVSGSALMSRFSGTGGVFDTRNVLMSAQLRFPLAANVAVETGITHVEISRDLEIRKDIVFASLEYQFPHGYSVELKYDLLSYDDFIDYQGNYASNILTVSLAKRFSAGSGND